MGFETYLLPKNPFIKGFYLLFSLQLSIATLGCGSGTIRSHENKDAATNGNPNQDASVTKTDGSVKADAETSGDSSVTVDGAATTDANVDEDAACVPETCTSLGYECDEWGNACGTIIDCGTCGTNETCDNGLCIEATVDCSGIENNPSFELCESGPDYCAGVFTQSEGCVAFCAAAGLVCDARYGGEPGCIKEPQNVLTCGENNGHASDWCECVAPNSNPDCPIDPTDPPTYHSQHYMLATYYNRSAWALECRDYGYTAYFEEHEACDSQYTAGSGQGSATFSFDVPQGEYEVFIEGRHTTSRNPNGALVTVTSGGQTHTTYINQRDSSGSITMDLHGQYCLSGSVVVVVDSTVSTASDSVRSVVLSPVQ